MPRRELEEQVSIDFYYLIWYTCDIFYIYLKYILKTMQNQLNREYTTTCKIPHNDVKNIFLIVIFDTFHDRQI